MVVFLVFLGGPVLFQLILIKFFNTQYSGYPLPLVVLLQKNPLGPVEFIDFENSAHMRVSTCSGFYDARSYDFIVFPVV